MSGSEIRSNKRLKRLTVSVLLLVISLFVMSQIHFYHRSELTIEAKASSHGKWQVFYNTGKGF